MIQGDRVILRPIGPADVPWLIKWQSDSDVMTGWAVPSPLLGHDAFQSDLAGRFRSFDRAGCFLIEIADGPIGRIDFSGFDERHRVAELSLYIGETLAWGKGYARDAMLALCRYLFLQRRAARIELNVITTNERARRLYESIGFQNEGTLRDHIFFDGAYHDELQMAVYNPGMLRTEAVP